MIPAREVPTKERIKQVFSSEYSGEKNAMTPTVYLQNYGYSLANECLYFEISEGTGLVSKWLIGVTVLEMTDYGARIRRHDLSTCFSGDIKHRLLSEAREYAESLE